MDLGKLCLLEERIPDTAHHRDTVDKIPVSVLELRMGQESGPGGSLIHLGHDSGYCVEILPIGRPGTV